MNKKRPVNLNLLTIQFPLPAIVSILHRLSGLFVFLLIPLLLWLLAVSLRSPDAFIQLQDTLANPCLKFVLWLLISALLYHLVAGIRHILMDMGLAESFKAGQLTARITMAIGIVLALLVGIWLW